MDAARYADSNGYEKDSVRFVWPYRDWVINAFNENLSYDQFIIKQIGGDLLPGARLSDRVATGFLRNSMVNEEGAIKYEQFRVEGIFDRMDAIGKSILGMTTLCSQCHTHKYDPLTQEEYYGMFAYLNNAHESTVPYYTDSQQNGDHEDRRERSQRCEDGGLGVNREPRNALRCLDCARQGRVESRSPILDGGDPRTDR